MTHAEEVMSKALREIEREAEQSKTRQLRHIHRLAEDALTYAWDDEKPAVDD